MSLASFFHRLRGLQRRLRSSQGIGNKLYLLTFVGGAAVLSLALVGLYFSFQIGKEAQELRIVELPTVRSLVTLEHLIADQRWHVRHPDSEAADDIDVLPATLSDQMHALASDATLPFDAALRGQLRELVELGEAAARKHDAHQHQQQLDYFLARSIEVQISVRDLLSTLTKTAERDVAQIITSSDRQLKSTIAICLILLLVLLPLMLWTIRNVVSRISRVAETMQRIANCDTSHDIPSTVDADEVGELARAVQVFKSNTMALLRNNDEIVRLNGWFDLALDNMVRGMSIFDSSQRLVMCNERYREIYELPRELVRPGTPFSTILEHWQHTHAIEKQRVVPANFDVKQVAKDYRTLVADGTEFVRVHSLPTGRIIVVTYRPTHDGGWVDVHEDVTDRICSEETIARLARVDQLTGLSNRRYFADSLNARLADCQAHSGRVSVVVVDVTNFKKVNDAHGHKTGDELLCQLARRLETVAGTGDLMARIGGDTFALCSASDDIVALAGRIQAVMTGTMTVGGQDVNVATAVGIASWPDHGDDAAELTQRAELALSQAKLNAGGSPVVFEYDLESTMRERQALEDDLALALDLDQLELHYQPIVDHRRGKVTSVEALMRWHHPQRGMVPPATFIPIAEDTGLISKLGEWAIRRACRDAKGWPARLRVAINLSAAQFESTDLLQVTREALQETGLSPSRLAFEVTESLLMQDRAEIRETLLQLQDMGIAIALDDFGTGYATLSYLRSFPFDKIKIDQTFVRDLPGHADCNAIVTSVVALAGMLGMRTVAEGIETLEHLEEIVAAGCDEIQGYFLSPAIPAADVLSVIAQCEDKLKAAA